MKLVLLSQPRSRSVYLYKLLQPYQKEKYNFLNVNGLHWGEFFNEINRKNTHFENGIEYGKEYYPVISNDGLESTWVWPYKLNNTISRHNYKFNLLSSEKENGREYFLKCMMNIGPSINDFLEFFKDRTIILTKREDKVAAFMSFAFAYTIKIYHIFNVNKEKYNSIIENGPVEISTEVINLCLKYAKEFSLLEETLIASGNSYKTITYEQLDDTNNISELLGTDEWKIYSDNIVGMPQKMERDYSQLIANYNEIKELLLNESII